MKYIMCSRVFPKGHPKQNEQTYFIEQILNSILPRPLTIGLNELQTSAREFVNDFFVIDGALKKHHTIRAGSRFKPGDRVSLRVWSSLPYRSKQVEFAQVEIKKTFNIEINNRFGHASFEVVINGSIYGQLHYGNDKNKNETGLIELSKNDGLLLEDFVDWFNIHPKKTGERFEGQIICWDDSIEY